MNVKLYLQAALVVCLLDTGAIYADAMSWQIKDLVTKADIIATVVVNKLDKKNDDLMIHIEHPNSGGFSTRHNPDYDEFMDVEFSVSDILKADSRHVHPSVLTIPALKGVGRLPKPVSFITGARYLVFLEYQDPNRSLQSLRLISQTSGAVRLEGDKVIKKPPLLDGYPPKYREFNEPQLLRRVQELITKAKSAVSAEDVNALNNTAGVFHPVDPNRIPEILTMISNRAKSNYDKIKTWQGEAEVTTDYIYEGDRAEREFRDNTDGTGEIPKILKKHIEARYQFALDVEKDILYTSLYRENPPAYMDLESGRNLGAKSHLPLCNFSITTPEYFIHSMPDAYRGNSIIRRSAIKQATEKRLRSEKAGAFDPRKIFTTGGAVWESFPLMLQYINEHGEYSFGGYDLKVEESISGNTTKYRVEIPNKSSSGKYHFLTMVFPSKAGFNMTSYKVATENGKILYEWKRDYGLIDGVYLPSTTSQRNFMREGGKLNYEEKYTFKNQKVNKPIPEETFTYKNLGLKDGDEFIDKITGKEFSYQNGKLIELAKEPPQKQLVIPDSNDPNQSP